MGLISDVKTELGVLDQGKPALKKFGILFAGIFLLASLYCYFKGFLTILIILFIISMYFFTISLLHPLQLKSVRQLWMTFALILGWIMSRFILLIIFFCVITPVSLLSRLVGNKFLHLDFKSGKSTYWTSYEGEKFRNYKKMF